MITCGIAWDEAHYDLALVDTKARPRAVGARVSRALSG